MKDYDAATPRVLDVAAGAGIRRIPDISFACHAVSDGQVLCGYAQPLMALDRKWGQLLEWQRCRGCAAVIAGRDRDAPG